jgi:hypothetical protein
MTFINNFEKVIPLIIVLLSILAALCYLLKMMLLENKVNLWYDVIYWTAASILTVAVIFKKG